MITVTTVSVTDLTRGGPVRVQVRRV